MKMRRKPMRGEKIRLATDGTLVTILEPLAKGFVKIITPDGMLTTVSKSELDLPTFDTAMFEKLE